MLKSKTVFNTFCDHWPDNEQKFISTRANLPLIALSRFVSQSPTHCLAWCAVSKVLVSQDLSGLLLLSLAQSSSHWLTLALYQARIGFISGSLWFTQPLSGSIWLMLPLSLAHSVTATLATFGTLWLTLIHSDSLWLFLWLSEALLGSQDSCSARYVIAAKPQFIKPCCQTSKM